MPHLRKPELSVAAPLSLPYRNRVPDDDQLDLFSSPAPTARRLFLDWDRPLLERAAEWLLDQAGESSLLDLSDRLVVVPTRNAGRRLREMLANLADERGTAILPPLVAPPNILVRPEAGAAEVGLPIAGDLETLATWIDVLLEAPLDQMRALFPLDPPARDFSWARGTARELVQLKAELGESGLTLSEVSRRLPAEHDEADRWADLAQLERAWQDRLRELGRCDREIVRALAARHASLPPGITEVHVIGTPDPLPLAIAALEHLTLSAVPVTIAIYAPESLSQTFDAWGRPIADAWNAMPIQVPDFSGTVTLVANSDALVSRVCEAASALEDPENSLGIGAVDSEVAPLLESALRRNGVPAFDPEGSRVQREGFSSLLESLGVLLQQPDFEAIRAILRIPEWDTFLYRKRGTWNSRNVLRALDESRARHLASPLADLIAFLRTDATFHSESDRERDRARAPDFVMAADGLEILQQVRRDLTRGPLANTLPPILRELVGSRPRRPGDWTEKVIETAAAPLMGMLAQLEKIESVKIALDPADQFSLLNDLIGQMAVNEDRPSLAIELQGWLELLWEDAPHLIVAGLNDGLVPGAIVGDAFLPESLRRLRTLDLKTNDDRLVRDLYLFRALLEPRRESGRLELLVPKTTTDGDPLRPSRLLFRCDDVDLPHRVTHLFQEVEAPGNQDSWSPGFELIPGIPREGQPPWKLQRIAVTAFSRYLESPFHFWSRQVVRMSEVDPDKAEMDDLDFGNFCHAVLEQYGRHEEARRWTDPEKIADFFSEVADRIALATYGPNPNLAVRIQLDAARRRLAEAAHHEAQQRANGWEILGAEVRLADSYSLSISGVEISGTIDRIERREGELRLLDFKTSDRRQPSLRDHLSEIRGSADPDWPPEYARFGHPDFFPRSAKAERSEKTYRFRKLQLPLYALAVSRAEPDLQIRCGYFHLAKAIADIGPEDWIADAELLSATERCAGGIITDVLAGRFERLDAPSRFDDLLPLHLGMPERTLDLTHVGGGDASPDLS